MITLRKSIAFLAVSLIFLLSACSEGVDVSKFQILEFNGHSYIAYDGENFDSGLLHNPDCKCGHGGR